ncbi:MAG: hypothetical protein V3T70_03335 [Phycisphaerae bacterium]
MNTSNPARLTHADSRRVDVEFSSGTEYTKRHRQSWPVLVQAPDAATLNPEDSGSWQQLWGQLGAEMYECFRDGDEHIRGDMITLARAQGGWQGRVVADRLEGWRRTLAS